jgi:hypothetical protein
MKMDLVVIGLSVVDWIGLAQDRYRWRALVNSETGKLPSGCTTCNLSSSPQLNIASLLMSLFVRLFVYLLVSQDVVHRPCNSEPYTPSSESFKFYFIGTAQYEMTRMFTPEGNCFVSKLFT